MGVGAGEDGQEARAELTAFLGRFPAHLRPLLQPLFFRLGGGAVADASVPWSAFVRGLGRLTGSGASWLELMEAWADTGGAEDLGLCVELAASLCFWCALRPAVAKATDSAPLDPERLVRILGVHAAAATASLPDDCENRVESAARALEKVVPYLPGAVGPCLAAALLGATLPSAPSQSLESRVLDANLELLLRGTDARLWESAAWTPLYRDWRDGRSFNGLLKGALGYSGPAALVIQTAGGEVLGSVCSRWEEGHGKFQSDACCFLFALEPNVHVFRASGSGNHVYLNSRNQHAPRGLGYGGQLGFCRFWLDADFEACHVLNSDATYASGPLLPQAADKFQTSFQVAHLEVWACGGAEAAAAHAAERERLAGVRDQARKVDRAKMIENEFDKEMFFGNTFKATADVREDTEVVDKFNGNK
eukprot:TRINITY_DN38179_c0_g1_i1.p1 TRINITY_DN38179_c0_g1~~TRINITY_DN38179_c0_g1_i1.p1  ORF type:complete len:448 (+),score=121.28 TRINITY_DN38179_c0_g1_i1:82-1344(+)